MCIKKINSWLAGALFALFASGAPGFVCGDGNVIVAQTQSITGTVVDDLGEPVIGASIRVSGTTNGTITDIDGKFTLDVSKGETLEISFVGYTTAKVAAAPGMVVTLSENSQFLEDVVVIGYGVQKKKLLTGATVQVKGDDLQKLSTTSALSALQSQTPGVIIMQNSGQAGEGFKVNIRGIGTVGDSNPLYVIDGVVGGDLNDLNPGDIESIDVLKDAASAAIYGARAANGVILITTKKGSDSKINMTYNGYVGWQYMYKRPDVANAQDYIYSRKLRARFGGQYAEPDWKAQLPADIYESLFDENGEMLENGWEGTDWLGASYHEGAMTQNHAISITGGNDVSTFSLGYSFTDQDGILGGINPSEYSRHTVRINTDHNIIKSQDKSYNVLTIGQTLFFSHNTRRGLSQGNMYWNNIKDLLLANPLFPIYDDNGNFYTRPEAIADGWNLDGSVQSNPIALAASNSHSLNMNKSWNMTMSAYVNLQPIKGLNIKSQFGYRKGDGAYRNMQIKNNIGANPITKDQVSQNMNVWSNISWNNTASYAFEIDNHSIDVVLGQAIEKTTYGSNINATASNLLFGESWDHAWLSNTEKLDISDVSVSGGPSADWSLASFFGRASWNYNEKYMAQFTLRADGSSNFARGNRWGYFPSGSVGWILSEESFMEKTKEWMDYLKLRASWGQNGNQSVSNFQYYTTVGFAERDSYYFGASGGEANNDTPTTGGYFATLANPDISWETSEQINVGIDARFLNNRLGFAFDWYKKTTKDWLVRAPILGVYGIGAPYINGGNVENSGVELALTWNDALDNGFRYGISANMAYNKNEVTKLANSEGILRGPGAVLHQLEYMEVYRAEVGQPIGYFYGFKTDGIFQNQSEVEAYRATIDDQMHGSDKLMPGDVRYVDVSGDGKITDADRTNIGDPHPDFTAGLSLTMSYKGFDFALTGAGAFGQQILRPWANQDFALQNPTKQMIYESWTGEGTSNKLPRFDSMDNINWKTMSQIWLEDADYFKIQNISLGYDFKTLMKSLPVSQLRLYVAANNVYTFTKYSGMDPEVGMEGGSGNSWAAGIDTGAYPSARTFMVGVQIKL